MKVTWLIPPTMNMEPVVNSLKLEKEIRFLNEDLDVSTLSSDLIIYIGAVAPPYQLPIETLKAVKDKAWFIKICCDADCTDWHPLLEQYAKENIFNLIVNINGNPNWPSRPIDLTLLSPIDPEPYNYDKEKSIWLGFCGGTHPGGERDILLRDLGSDVVIGNRIEAYGQHQQYVDFLKSCYCTLNIPYSSSGKSTRVNGRILEAALAGNVVIEKANSQSSHWFVPDYHYLEYETVHDIRNNIKKLREDPHLKALISKNLKDFVNYKYSAKHFWSQVFGRLGLGAGIAADC